jgi:hypothetical protein
VADFKDEISPSEARTCVFDASAGIQLDVRSDLLQLVAW